MKTSIHRIRAIVDLHNQGWSERKIALAYKMGRKTVHKYILEYKKSIILKAMEKASKKQFNADMSALLMIIGFLLLASYFIILLLK